MFSPNLDLREKDDAYVVRVDLPGSDKSDLHVSLEDRMLTVSGSRDEEMQEEEHGKVVRTERRHGQFQRSLGFPGPVDPDGLTATYKNGVLTVTVPKAGSDTSPRTVPVK